MLSPRRPCQDQTVGTLFHENRTVAASGEGLCDNPSNGCHDGKTGTSSRTNGRRRASVQAAAEGTRNVLKVSLASVAVLFVGASLFFWNGSPSSAPKGTKLNDEFIVLPDPHVSHRITSTEHADEARPARRPGRRSRSGRSSLNGSNPFKWKVVLPQSIQSAAVSESPVTVWIESTESKNRSVHARCREYFVANVTGRATYSPRVYCHSPGRYRFSVQLDDPGEYKLSVRMSGSVGRNKGSDRCLTDGVANYLIGPGSKSPRPAATFVYSPPSRPRRSGHAVRPALEAPSGTGSQQRGKAAWSTGPATSRHCDPERFYSGRFVSAIRNPAMALGGPHALTWRPFDAAASCDWPAHWNRSRVESCAGGKWLAFIGDSTLNEVACDMAYDLYGKFDSGWRSGLVLRCNSSATRRPVISKCPRIWDTGALHPHLPRISFYFIGHPDPCKNCQGVGTVLEAAVQQELKKVFGELARPQRQADVLYFNSGLHDMCALDDDYRFDSYLHKLDKALELVRALGKRMVWKSSSPKLRRRACSKYFGHAPRVQWMNDEAEALARARGFSIADQYHINLAATDRNDGRHCRTGLACFTYAASLLNYVCS